MKLDFKGKINSENYINENIESLICRKVLFTGDLTFTDCIINTIDIDNIRFKSGSISFRRCKFIGYTSFKNIKIEENISFIECESEVLIKFFKIESKSELYFEYYKSEKKIEFMDMTLSILRIHNSTFDNVSLLSNLSNKIDNIIIESSEATNSFNLSGLTNVKSINLNSIKANELKITTIDFSENSDFLISNSSISFFKLDLLNSKDNIKFNLDDNLVEILQINKIKLLNSTMSISNGFYKNLIIKKDLSDSLTIDFSAATIENLDLDESLFSFIKSKINDEIILKKNNFLQNSITLKMLSKMFADNYQYSLQDLCFYHYNNFHLKNEIIESKSIFNKLALRSKLFFGKYILGWGVKLGNILLSFLYITILYSIVYFVLLNTNDLVIKFKNMDFGNDIYHSFITSLLGLFGSFSDFETNSEILEMIIYSEHLIGILMLALLTGTIIRKLVR